MLSTQHMSSRTKRTVDVYVGIGSNLEDRRLHISTAISDIKHHAQIVVEKISSIIETEPLGGPRQPNYLNCVVKLRTQLEPEELLKVLHDIEHKHGRARTCKNGPRTLDLDILLYDDYRIEGPTLTIPHPRMLERSFVMGPLREIEPDIETQIHKLRRA
jgi:2-amino-4-hydroxy-6-hydroxymethyldihydropteridine diphosphokinase